MKLSRARSLKALPLFLIPMFGLSSCGYRENQNNYDNVFSGDWEASRIRCYLDVTSDAADEIYEIDSVGSILYSFDGRAFTYSAQINDSPGCQVSATGYRSVDYYNNYSGEVSFNSVSDHNACLVEMDDVDSRVTGVQVPFGINEAAAEELSWYLEENLLEIKVPLVFNGSEEGDCEGNCECFTYLERL